MLLNAITVVLLVAIVLLAWRVFLLERRIAGLHRRLTALEGRPAAPAAERSVRKVRRDWEALVGTDWLSRLGAVMLVIGIALFLGYSLTQLGPAGKIAIGLTVGASLLAGGIVLSRRTPWRTYSWSLMGAGWAVLYFTTFALHGLPAARLIESAAGGTAALTVVTAAMILHAMRYRSETATGLACLLGFIGLHAAPVTPFSVFATVLLTLSLVALSWRFSWFRLPLLGVIVVYLGFALRFDVVHGQAALWTYWLAFESYDLLLASRLAAARPRFARALLPLNFCGFTGAYLLHTWTTRQADWWIFFASAALALLGSAVLRARLARMQDAERPAVPQDWEIAAVGSALLTCAALVDRFSGTAITLALLLEGELIVLTGAALGSRWIERLGAAILSLPVLRLLTIDAGTPRWTPTALLGCGVLAANRAFFPRAWYFAAGASAVAAALAIDELPRLWSAPAIAAGALGLLLSRRTDRVWISVPGLLFAFGRAFVVNTSDVLTTALVVLALYAGAHLWPLAGRVVRTSLSLLGTALLTFLVYDKAHGRLLTVSLGVEGGLLLAAGFLLQDRTFRLSGLMLFLLCIARLFVHDLRQLDAVSRILSFIVLGVVLMAGSWLYTRFRDKFTGLL